MESVDKKFGDILKQLRIDKGLTQQGLGKELNISKSAISHYEKGDNCPPLSILVTIARYFNVSSEIGKELDSLADLISFGVAPALLVFIKYYFQNIGYL